MSVIQFRVCFALIAGVVCSDEQLPGAVPALQCAMLGQAYVARWISEHENASLAGPIVCKPAREREA